MRSIHKWDHLNCEPIFNSIADERMRPREEKKSTVFHCMIETTVFNSGYSCVVSVCLHWWPFYLRLSWKRARRSIFSIPPAESAKFAVFCWRSNTININRQHITQCLKYYKHTSTAHHSLSALVVRCRGRHFTGPQKSHAHKYIVLRLCDCIYL